jgi:hypothetical protein
MNFVNGMPAIKKAHFIFNALGVALQFSAACAVAQTWNYRIDTRQSSGGTGGTEFGFVRLEYKDGKPIVAMGGRLSSCWNRSDLKAQVEKTDELLTITIEPALNGCEEVRLLIKTDGTGGKRQIKVNENWVDDRTNRDLTLRK